MARADKQFCAFLRMIIRDLNDIHAEEDMEKKQKLIEDLKGDLQKTLED